MNCLSEYLAKRRIQAPTWSRSYSPSKSSWWRVKVGSVYLAGSWWSRRTTSPSSTEWSPRPRILMLVRVNLSLGILIIVRIRHLRKLALHWCKHRQWKPRMLEYHSSSRDSRWGQDLIPGPGRHIAIPCQTLVKLAPDMKQSLKLKRDYYNKEVSSYQFK